MPRVVVTYIISKKNLFPRWKNQTHIEVPFTTKLNVRTNLVSCIISMTSMSHNHHEMYIPPAGNTQTKLMKKSLPKNLIKTLSQTFDVPNILRVVRIKIPANRKRDTSDSIDFQPNPIQQHTWSTTNMHNATSSHNTYPVLRVDGQRPESSEIRQNKIFPTHYLPTINPHNFNLKSDNNKRKFVALSGAMCQKDKKLKAQPTVPYMASVVGNGDILDNRDKKSPSISNDSQQIDDARYDQQKRILTPLDKMEFCKDLGHVWQQALRKRLGVTSGIHINENPKFAPGCTMPREVHHDFTSYSHPTSSYENQSKNILFESSNMDSSSYSVSTSTVTNNTNVTDGVPSSDNHATVQNKMTHNHTQQSYVPSFNEHNSSTSTTSYSEDQKSVSHLYINIGDCEYACQYCKAAFWYGERLKTGSRWQPVKYNKCCAGGQVYLQKELEPPMFFKQIFKDKHFLDNIRAYNQMFSMTSFGTEIDDSINDDRGPYVLKISGEIHHWIGTICPTNRNEPKFMQLYIYDTQNEVANRMKPFGGKDRSNLKPEMLYNVVGNREYQLSSSGTLGAILFESGSNSQTDYDVIIEYKDRHPQRINKLHSSYMSLQFPLLFVYGQPGYNTKMTLKGVNANRKRNKLSMNMYYKYQLHEIFDQYGLLFKAGRTSSEVTVFPGSVMHFQKETISGVLSAKNYSPSSFTGGPRYMYSHYLDALAICRVLGNPQYFITFTCNVNWPEIKRHMKRYPEISQSDRPDVVCRIFQEKLNDFLKVLKLELVIFFWFAVLYTIEFQKRGLPHCHTLLWIDARDKIKDREEVDNFISAKLPDKTSDPEAYIVVVDLMMHGQCGNGKPKAPCMQEGVCTKNFPKKYTESTYFDKDGHIHYRRRSTSAYVQRGELKLDNNYVVSYNRLLCLMFHAHINVERSTSAYVQRGELKLDNNYVVSYNRLLCLMFHAHINVEYCGWSMIIKYLFKYISKGTDWIAARIVKPIGDPGPSPSSPKIRIDEIQNFIDGRFLFHLQEMQHITFGEQEPLARVVTDDGRKLTTLTEWFTYNTLFTDGRHLTYLDFPSEYVWYEEDKAWRRRKIKTKHSIGRLAYVHPAAGELFYFRMLLAHQKRCKSFTEVRTVNNHTFPTYRAACQAMGLLDDEKEWDISLEEASMTATVGHLRTLFCHILMYCEVSDPLKLWERHWRLMADDIPRKASETSNVRTLYVNDPETKNYIMYELEVILNSCLGSLKDYGFSLPPDYMIQQLHNRLLMEERNYNREELKQEAARSVVRLNAEPWHVYNLIVNACANKEQELLFVYGHGGTGKTFLWKTIINTLRSDGKIVLAVASSGVTSLLLPSGRTAHSRFKIPLELTNESMCILKKNTLMADLVTETDLIIWDEAPMNDRRCFETLDRTLRDILSNPDNPFGGKPVMLGGDFKQTLPHFKVCKLKKTCGIGDGNIGEPDEENSREAAWIKIPSQYQIPDDETSMQKLIDFIYDKDTLQQPTAQVLQQKAIVCPKNETANIINEHILSQVEGQSVVYLSTNEAIPLGKDGAATEMSYPPEYLNTFKFSGLPPGILQLKIGSPIMLLRNVNLGGGLCNDTMKNLTSKLIEAEIITGTKIGEKFPVKLCYAMTINKSQGQSLSKIGIYLPQPVFGHGQLYVALLMATSPYGLKILLKSNGEQAMADSSITPIQARGKQKMIEVEANIRDLKPKDGNRIIEAKIYRAWMARDPPDTTEKGCRAILQDREVQ
ncbi:DNA helicase [Artemisia annua]|uniref:ATP-dependent DNA helicase n=1 Tax=Artemisia annua TaxID=35608 RepID=A0A2U1LNE4_ARTAN|nr:DNA helicase [Artemisia annua]